MAMENENNLRQNNDADSVSDNRDSRRKWLRKISVATPALLLLANRPVMAASCSISGFMSVRVGTSLTTHDPGLCDGWSPGNWKNVNGQIGQAAWDLTGVSRTATYFNQIFTTVKLAGTGITINKVVGGTVSGVVERTSDIAISYLDAINGNGLSGANNHKNIVSHAAATYLNGKFLENGGRGTNPDPWMINYLAPADVIALYLLYELTHLIVPVTGESYIVQRNGSMIADGSLMATGDFASFFVSLANGSGSQAWQDG